MGFIKNLLAEVKGTPTLCRKRLKSHSMSGSEAASEGVRERVSALILKVDVEVEFRSF